MIPQQSLTKKHCLGSTRRFHIYIYMYIVGPCLFDTGAKTGELDFHKFVWLMRKCDDMRDEADVKMEAEVVEDASVKPQGEINSKG